MPGKKEKLVEFQKQKEDIEMLLSSLEEAYNEASISEEHYSEVKGKNQKKLDEINAEIAKLEKEVGKIAPEPAETGEPAKEQAKEPAKEQANEQAESVEEKPKKGKGKKTKKKPEDEKYDEPIIPMSQPGPGEGLGGDETPGAPPLESAPPEPAKKISKDMAAVGTVDTSDIKNVITRLVNEIRPAGIEVLPRVEKMQVQLEKLKAFIDAVKEEKEGQADAVRRIMEELGELRSSTASIDGRLSDVAIKTDDITGTMAMLKPERFTKLLTKLDSGIKENGAKIEKLDEITSVIIKKVGLIEDVLSEMGSLEKVVEFSKNIASRMIMVDETEKRIKRVGDKIDGIFIELNKRLEDFMLYKAKQDTASELIQEMMKGMDEVNTRISGMVTKEELEELRDNLETRMSAMADTGMQESPRLVKYNEQKDEINSVLEMMEEQFKAGTLKKDEYEKAKKVNLDRLRDIEKKIADERSGASAPGGMVSAPAPSTEPAETGAPAKEPAKEEAGGGAETPAETSESAKEAGEPAKEQTKPAEEPAKEESKDKDIQGAPAGYKGPITAGGKPAETGEPVKAEETAKDKPKQPEKEEPKKSEKPEPKEPRFSKKEMMMRELEDSFRKGLISRGAYEKTKKLLGG
jgi:hypothetical protein